MKKSYISLALSSILTFAFAEDVAIDLTPPKAGEEPSKGNPARFEYAYDKDGTTATKPTEEVKIYDDYFWNVGTGNNLGLLAKKDATSSTDLVATAIFNAPGNNDNLLLENFNYISVNDKDISKKGEDDTYFAILNGAIPYASFTLNNANIFSGSNLFVGPIGGTNSKTGGFKSVILKGNIKVDANAIDQNDDKGSGKKDATLNFNSEYKDATYTIESGAVLDLTSTTGDKKSTINFKHGGENQSVINKGEIKVTNTTANTQNNSDNEKNNINFQIDLKNEGTITLANSTLNFKDANLTISDEGSVGTINIAAKEDKKENLGTGAGAQNATNNTSTLLFENTDTQKGKTFSIKSQNINITGTKPSDADSEEKNPELFGAKLTISLKDATQGTPQPPNPDASEILFTGSKDKLTTITIGSGSGNDKNTSLAFDVPDLVSPPAPSTANLSTKVRLDNYAAIVVQSGAKLDLTGILAQKREYKSGGGTTPPNTDSIINFFNQGQITFKGDGENTNILEATDKKVVLSDYATTKTSCAIGEDGDCGTGISNVGSIPKNGVLTTKEEATAGTFEVAGGKTQLLADMVYVYGNLVLSGGGTLDLSKIAKAQDGNTTPNGTPANAIGFVNAGIFTSQGGVIDTRTKQDKPQDNDKDSSSSGSSNGNLKALIITEAKKEKTKDTADSDINKNGGTKLSEGEAWEANKQNESRAEFIVDSGVTTIRAKSITNKGLTAIQNGGTLSMACVGTDYCYSGGYWTDEKTKDGDKEYIKAPETDSASGKDKDKFTAKELIFDNDGTTQQPPKTGGELMLKGGTLTSLDTYKYQEKDGSDYKDIAKTIYHALTIKGGTLSAGGDATSIIRSGYGDSSGSNHNTTIEGSNLAIRGASKLLFVTEKDKDTKATNEADVTWKNGTQAGSGSNTHTFTMYLGDNDFTNNARGFYILGSADDKGNYKGGVIKFGENGSDNLPDFIIDLSDLSKKNTILLDKQYNFLVARDIQKGGKAVEATDVTMKINFGKGADTTSGADKPATNDKEYGSYNDALCKNDSKFCLDAKDTSTNGGSGATSGSIEIGSSTKPNEGVLVVDKSEDSKLTLEGVTDTTWPNGSTSGNGETYSDFVTFNKIVKQGTGNCNIETLEGCAIIGFSAVKSKTLQKDGVSAVFQSIKDRAAQLPQTSNSVISNTLKGINLIENTNENASRILQGLVDSEGVTSSNILLTLQKFQYTGQLSLAQQVANDLNVVDDTLDAISNLMHNNLELINRVNFTSTLNTSARLAQNSNPYKSSMTFARAIESLSKKRFAANESIYNYTDRFDYDHNAWAMAIGGVGGYYSGGVSALGGLSAGYDRMLGRFLVGGYVTYAYGYSVINEFNGNAGVRLDNNSNNLEIGAYMRAYVDAHEADVVVSETMGFNKIDIKNEVIPQIANSMNFTTNITARYGYVFPINVDSGLYVKPLAGINYVFQYSGHVVGSGETAIDSNSKMSHMMTLSALAEVRKYFDDKKYFYITSGLEQDLFAIAPSSRIYFANSANNTITYQIDNMVRTYLTVIGGGEIEVRDNMAVTFGIGAKISWDRYFINGNVGFKYKFNSN